MALPSPTVAPPVPGAILRGSISCIFVPTVANINAPTSVEMTAGTDYKAQINALDGFMPEGGTVDYGNAGNRLIGNIPGTITMGTGTVTFNLNRTAAGVDARSAFVDGTDGTSQPTTGYWYLIPEGIVTSAKMRGFQVTVTSASPSYDLDSPKSMQVMYAIQAATGFITVPTA